MKRLHVWGLLAALAVTAGEAKADERAVCLDAASRGQTARDGHDLLEAREQFRTCAREQCPSVVQKDCAGWLSEVERGLPTVVFAAKSQDGADLFDVRVSVDGKPLVARLDGQAVALNPGAHAFRFDLADGTSAELQVLVREGAKNQSVQATLKRAVAPVAPVVPAAPPLAQPAHEEPPPPSPSTGLGSRKIAGLVVGGVGVVAGGFGAAFGAMASSSWDTAQKECPSHAGCSAQATSDRSSAVSSATVSTIALVAGGVLLAGGVVLFVTAPRPGAVSVGLGVAPNGLCLSGRF